MVFWGITLARLAKFLNVSFEWLATGNIIENNQNMIIKKLCHL
ncbi:hypothetical protein [uncultured Gammaproteobacteria bacterium]|nr:hypothetical protein [uncultured Gammaproteobacteria bacterium]